MFCVHCGSELTQGMRFCSNCGKDSNLEEGSPENPVKTDLEDGKQSTKETFMDKLLRLWFIVVAITFYKGFIAENEYIMTYFYVMLFVTCIVLIVRYFMQD